MLADSPHIRYTKRNRRTYVSYFDTNRYTDKPDEHKLSDFDYVKQ